MKVGIVISFYDEHYQVVESLDNIKNNYPDACISMVHTDDESGDENIEIIKEKSDFYETVDDLSKKYDRNSYQSRTISRNFSIGFSNLYNSQADFDLICALTGDTLVKDSTFLARIYYRMQSEDKIAAISQAIGQKFHAPEDDLITHYENRVQHETITDFMPQLFALEGTFATATQCFADVEVTNAWTSEQCLGDELSSQITKYGREDFHGNIFRLNEENKFSAYHFHDGVTYHSKNNGTPGR